MMTPLAVDTQIHPQGVAFATARSTRVTRSEKTPRAREKDSFNIGGILNFEAYQNVRLILLTCGMLQDIVQMPWEVNITVTPLPRYCITFVGAKFVNILKASFYQGTLVTSVMLQYRVAFEQDTSLNHPCI